MNHDCKLIIANMPQHSTCPECEKSQRHHNLPKTQYHGNLGVRLSCQKALKSIVSLLAAGPRLPMLISSSHCAKLSDSRETSRQLEASELT
jgi:hypothetical protein